MMARLRAAAGGAQRRDEGSSRERLASFSDGRAQRNPRFCLNEQLLKHLRPKSCY